ncbi:MAG: hypothetical protein D6704_07080 [Nitrospirae bacterium]|nr:MAG: hypothetical protein D6704_07080 [Nitrospirota bacterium]
MKNERNTTVEEVRDMSEAYWHLQSDITQALLERDESRLAQLLETAEQALQTISAFSQDHISWIRDHHGDPPAKWGSMLSYIQRMLGQSQARLVENETHLRQWLHETERQPHERAQRQAALLTKRYAVVSTAPHSLACPSSSADPVNQTRSLLQSEAQWTVGTPSRLGNQVDRTF